MSTELVPSTQCCHVAGWFAPHLALTARQRVRQADFSFFFDAGGRRRCYIAPERFYESAGADAALLASQPLEPAMVRPTSRPLRGSGGEGSHACLQSSLHLAVWRVRCELPQQSPASLATA